MRLKELVGSGDKIALLTLPVLLVGIPLNLWRPSLFSVGGPPFVLEVVSIVVLIPGAVIWLWSVVLVVTRVPRGELITSGPFCLVKHPIYTSVALLVAPWIGFLLNSWFGTVVGIVVFVGCRLFAPEEERALSKSFGAAWSEYCTHVRIRWL